MNESIEQIHRFRFILSVVSAAIFGGGFLIGLMSLVYFLGTLAEKLP